MRNIVIIIIILALGAVGWYFYQESQKSDLEKAAEDLAGEVEDTADAIADEIEN